MNKLNPKETIPLSQPYEVEVSPAPNSRLGFEFHPMPEQLLESLMYAMGGQKHNNSPKFYFPDSLEIRGLAYALVQSLPKGAFPPKLEYRPAVTVNKTNATSRDATKIDVRYRSDNGHIATDSFLIFERTEKRIEGFAFVYCYLVYGNRLVSVEAHDRVGKAGKQFWEAGDIVADFPPPFGKEKHHERILSNDFSKSHTNGINLEPLNLKGAKENDEEGSEDEDTGADHGELSEGTNPGQLAGVDVDRPEINPGQMAGAPHYPSNGNTGQLAGNLETNDLADLDGTPANSNGNTGQLAGNTSNQRTGNTGQLAGNTSNDENGNTGQLAGNTQNDTSESNSNNTKPPFGNQIADGILEQQRIAEYRMFYEFSDWLRKLKSVDTGKHLDVAATFKDWLLVHYNEYRDVADQLLESYRQFAKEEGSEDLASLLTFKPTRKGPPLLLDNDQRLDILTEFFLSQDHDTLFADQSYEKWADKFEAWLRQHYPQHMGEVSILLSYLDMALKTVRQSLDDRHGPLTGSADEGNQHQQPKKRDPMALPPAPEPKKWPFSANFNKLLKLAPGLQRKLKAWSEAVLRGDEPKTVYGKSSFKKDKYEERPVLMDFNLELLDQFADGTFRLAISHYFEQNGDLVPDPDMEIRVSLENRTIEALSFSMPNYYREVYPIKNGKRFYSSSQRADQNKFLNSWLNNCIDQGHSIVFYDPHTEDFPYERNQTAKPSQANNTPLHDGSTDTTGSETDQQAALKSPESATSTELDYRAETTYDGGYIVNVWVKVQDGVMYSQHQLSQAPTSIVEESLAEATFSGGIFSPRPIRLEHPDDKSLPMAAEIFLLEYWRRQKLNVNEQVYHAEPNDTFYFGDLQALAELQQWHEFAMPETWGVDELTQLSDRFAVQGRLGAAQMILETYVQGYPQSIDLAGKPEPDSDQLPYRANVQPPSKYGNKTEYRIKMWVSALSIPGVYFMEHGHPTEPSQTELEAFSEVTFREGKFLPPLDFWSPESVDYPFLPTWYLIDYAKQTGQHPLQILNDAEGEQWVWNEEHLQELEEQGEFFDVRPLPYYNTGHLESLADKFEWHNDHQIAAYIRTRLIPEQEARERSVNGYPYANATFVPTYEIWAKDHLVRHLRLQDAHRWEIWVKTKEGVRFHAVTTSKFEDKLPTDAVATARTEGEVLPPLFNIAKSQSEVQLAANTVPAIWALFYDFCYRKGLDPVALFRSGNPEEAALSLETIAETFRIAEWHGLKYPKSWSPAIIENLVQYLLSLEDGKDIARKLTRQLLHTDLPAAHFAGVEPLGEVTPLFISNQNPLDKQLRIATGNGWKVGYRGNMLTGGLLIHQKTGRFFSVVSENERERVVAGAFERVKSIKVAFGSSEKADLVFTTFQEAQEWLENRGLPRPEQEATPEYQLHVKIEWPGPIKMALALDISKSRHNPLSTANLIGEQAYRVLYAHMRYGEGYLEEKHWPASGSLLFSHTKLAPNEYQEMIESLDCQVNKQRQLIIKTEFEPKHRLQAISVSLPPGTPETLRELVSEPFTGWGQVDLAVQQVMQSERSREVHWVELDIVWENGYRETFRIARGEFPQEYDYSIIRAFRALSEGMAVTQYQTKPGQPLHESVGGNSESAAVSDEPAQVAPAKLENSRPSHELNQEITAFVLEKDNREESYSPAELEYISQYSGAGGLASQGAEGTGLLYEFYTPKRVARMCWMLAIHNGFEGGRVLEPACGTGHFISEAPANTTITGYETNPVSARICQLLYPNATIYNLPFESLFFKRNTPLRGDFYPQDYDLVIGNPPYGEFNGKYAGMGEQEYTKARTYEGYFLLRGLDQVRSGGLLVYVVPNGWLESKSQYLPVMKQIADKAEWIDGRLLTEDTFLTTNVQTSIVVFRKR